MPFSVRNSGVRSLSSACRNRRSSPDARPKSLRAAVRAAQAISGLNWERKFYPSSLSFHGGESISTHVKDVVNQAHDPEISVFIFARAVAREIHSRNLRPVIFHA